MTPGRPARRACACGLAAAALLLGGCATPRTTLYEWGGYDRLLYESYKSPERVESLRVGLETLLARLELQQQKVPPGLHAELGTLYLEAGDNAKAAAQYDLERRRWPESKLLMDALIKTLERRGAPPTGGEALK